MLSGNHRGSEAPHGQAPDRRADRPLSRARLLLSVRCVDGAGSGRVPRAPRGLRTRGRPRRQSDAEDQGPSRVPVAGRARAPSAHPRRGRGPDRTGHHALRGVRLRQGRPRPALRVLAPGLRVLRAHAPRRSHRLGRLHCRQFAERVHARSARFAPRAGHEARRDLRQGQHAGEGPGIARHRRIEGDRDAARSRAVLAAPRAHGTQLAAEPLDTIAASGLRSSTYRRACSRSTAGAARRSFAASIDTATGTRTRCRARTSIRSRWPSSAATWGKYKDGETRQAADMVAERKS